MYQSKNLPNGSIAFIRTNSDGTESGIPLDPNNTDYQEYLAWLAEGNTPLPPDQPDPWETIRQKRDQLIRDSDWTMIPGATVDQAQWSAYRQILRDLPQTYSNPEDVVWPTTPSTSGPNTIEE
jgi:hypothetical protein